MSLFGQATLRTENPTGIHGPLPHALVRALLGGGIGYASSHVTGANPTMSALIGAGIGGLSSVPEILTQINHARAGKIPNVKTLGQSLFSSYPYTKPEKTASDNLQTFGSINLPKEDPLLFSRKIASKPAKQLIKEDMGLSPVQRLQVSQLVEDAEKESDMSGLISTGDIIKAGLGAGIGFGGAYVTGKVLGTVFGLPSNVQKRMAQVGAIGGALRATGVWS